jgi:hypothetical protein
MELSAAGVAPGTGAFPGAALPAAQTLGAAEIAAIVATMIAVPAPSRLNPPDWIFIAPLLYPASRSR